MEERKRENLSTNDLTSLMGDTAEKYIENLKKKQLEEREKYQELRHYLDKYHGPHLLKAFDEWRQN
jgi:hypothetical protein